MVRRSALALAVMGLGAVSHGRASAQTRADPSNGEALFNDLCSGCHIRSGGGLAPSLVGVVGRPAASVPGALYTRALRASRLVWTAQTLDVFLTNPSAMAPGTAMPMAIPDPKDRADVIAFLASPANRP